jgi:hypothetical protein
MTQKQAAIEQINLGYNDQQDRLLLKLGLVDKTEISVWVTRRICRVMWSLLQGANMSLSPSSSADQSLPDPATSSKEQAIQSFEREVAVQKAIENMDFNSEYLTDRQNRTDEPLLAIQCMTIAIEGQAPHLELQCLGGQAVKIALNNELVHAITNMMQLATREAGWDLLFVADKSQTGVALGQSLH